jgi:dinuclear metal center YbgI/SA1388 family protein
MTTVEDICRCIEDFAPLSLQESWDNSGLCVGSPRQLVNMALLTVDVTEAVVMEAVKAGAQLIVSHHPVTLSGVRRLTGATETERTLMAAVRHGIAIYSAHTNLDSASGGISHRMAQLLGLKDVRPLIPQGNGTVGMGAVGTLPAPMDEEEWLRFIKEVFGAKVVRYTPLRGKKIHRAALCGGSGSSLLHEAVASQADAYVTADFKYHQFADAAADILVADVGHFESEQCAKEIFYELISEKMPTFAVRFSEVNTNPINCL